MKSIVAFIQPFKEDAVREALHSLSGISGATFMHVRGFGRGRGNTDIPSEEAVVGTLPKVRVDIMADDHIIDQAVTAIARAAHTGRRGDGKVYVLPVESALRISTGETGATAV